MRLFFHHVGQKGAAEDFKKTVFARVPTSLVETSLSEMEPAKAELLGQLNAKFPIGSFNSWGVPSGAAAVIRSLQIGDAVLLIESASEYGGSIPAFGIVKAFVRQELPTLSHALWGNEHFPFVFFFETELLELSWLELLSDLGYKANFDPRGNFYSVADERLAAFGGAAGYVKYIRTRRAKWSALRESAAAYVVGAVGAADPDYRTSTSTELSRILSDSERASPQLTQDADAPVQTTLTPRDAAFRNEIRLIYGERCAVCGSNRYGPDGSPEVEGAHIYPKRLKGRDVVENGISLCKLHHWAFDAGWFSVEDDLTIIVRPDMPRLEAYRIVADYEGKKISVPANPHYRPHPVFLRAHRKLHGLD